MAKCKVIKKDSVIDEICDMIKDDFRENNCGYITSLKRILPKYIPQTTTLKIELTQEEVERIKSNEYTLGPGISIETMSTISQALKESLDN